MTLLFSMINDPIEVPSVGGLGDRIDTKTTTATQGYLRVRVRVRKGDFNVRSTTGRLGSVWGETPALFRGET